ncbi:MAG: TonB-dependent receptor [Gemmatimonadota bacterium]|nr:TonB-dependent receptor [Gemmatimonadota bacterium]
MRIHFVILAAGTLLLPASSHAIETHVASRVTRAAHHFTGDVAGRITSRNGSPLSDATIAIPELARSATSSADGRFRFDAIPAGHYTLSVRRPGFRTSARAIVVGDVALDVDVALDSGAVAIEPVNVTASRAAVDAVASPLSTSILIGDDVHPASGISLAHSVAQLAGVRNVSSGQQVGKPMIRGLFGPRVLVLTDGSRLEDYSWSDEDGPSLDARLAQRIEVIRGPASVLYGSEALGGVVNVIPAELPFSADGATSHRGALEAYGGSNNTELGSAGMLEGTNGRYGWRGLATGRFALDVQTPKGKLQNSSFFAVNGEGALGINGAHGNTTIRAAHYGGEFHLLEARGPEAGDSTGGPVRQTLDDRLQVTNNYAINQGLRIETKAQYQRHSLTEVSDDCQPAPGQTTCVKVKDQKAFGLVLNTGTADVLAHHTVGPNLSGTLGVSTMYQLSGTSGPIYLVPGATTTAFGAFSFEQLTFGPVSLVTGLRADTRSLSSDASAPLSLAADSRNWTATTGDIGMVVRPIPEVSLVANLGTGWRAPTLFDLYTNGPNAADARYEIGDPTLKTERDHSFDGGIRWSSPRVRGEATVFQNSVDDYIFTTPTTENIGGLKVFRHTQGNARLTGAELAASVDVLETLTLRANHDFVNGSARATGAPLPLMPPPRSIIGANFHSTSLGWTPRASLGAEMEINQRQTRLDPNDVPANGYTLLNLDASFEYMVHTRPLRFDIDVRNATNATYTDYLSRYKRFSYGQGVNVILKVATLGW